MRVLDTPDGIAYELTPEMIEAPDGLWTCLDPITADDWHEDRSEVLSIGIPKYAHNVVVKSGRTWKWTPLVG